MKSKTFSWNKHTGWNWPESIEHTNWILYFGSRHALAASGVYASLRAKAPSAIIMGCSTGGEILGPEVLDDTVVVAAITFDATPIRSFQTTIATDGKVDDKSERSFEAGERIAQALNDPALTGIFLLSDGLRVNGTELIRGMYSRLPASVIITGGLAGDGPDFNISEVGLNEAPATGEIAAIGFYGDRISIGYGSVGGWDAFGPDRTITRASANILYELDEKPALDLYKDYLGECFNRPDSALNFPLSIRPSMAPAEHQVMRTIVGLDEEHGALVFAGDVPEGYTARLMRANTDHLVDGASFAALLASKAQDGGGDLAILVSCIGRKLIMGQRICDETEVVAEVLGKVPTIGFYSYGEICHHSVTSHCSLHNQTMTITLLRET